MNLQCPRRTELQLLGIDTVFLTTSLKYAYLSSSIVKEMAMYGGDIHKFVPEEIIDRVYEKYGIT